jgi:hypothetical protein
MTGQKLPATRNIPELSINIEGLRRFADLSVFLPEPNLSAQERQLREWMRHTIVSATRHYREARELVAKQESADQVRDGGVIFYVFEVPGQLEGCVLSLHRICNALRRLSKSDLRASEFCQRFEAAIAKLGKLRNQFEHMDSQIVPGQNGSGPIVIVFEDEAECLRFRSFKMPTVELHSLIEGAFSVVAALYPQFDAASKPTPGGFAKLEMTFTARVINQDGSETLIV